MRRGDVRKPEAQAELLGQYRLHLFLTTMDPPATLGALVLGVNQPGLLEARFDA